MRSWLRQWVGVGAILVLVCLTAVFLPVKAFAGDNEVRNLQVTFAIQPDGSVKVRQQFDWTFLGEDNHGIVLGYPLRERWGADRAKDVRYDISGISVQSPTGAPDQFKTETKQQGETTVLSVKIGDPNKTVTGRDHTYVVTYTVRGALRTFDGKPEFFWDVTSADFPSIQKFSVTVTAPGGITGAKCLVGRGKCAASTTKAGASYSGTSVSANTPITVYAGLQPGKIANTQPVLDYRDVNKPHALALDVTSKLAPDGSMLVTETGTFLMPARPRASLTWTLPVRRPWSDTQDRVTPLTDVTVTVDGQKVAPVLSRWTPLVSDLPLPQPGEWLSDWWESSTQWTRIRAVSPSGKRVQKVVLSYRVSGVVTKKDAGPRLEWPLTGTDAPDVHPMNFRWELPVNARQAKVGRRLMVDNQETSSIWLYRGDWTINGTVVSWRSTGVDKITPELLAQVSLADAPSLVANPMLEPSADKKNLTTLLVTGGAGLVGAIVLRLVGGAAARRPVALPQRYAGLPPGIVAEGAEVEEFTHAHTVPVRFEPPEARIDVAGVLHYGAHTTKVLAATLVQMAVGGVLWLRTQPLRLARGPRPPAPGLAARVYDAIGQQRFDAWVSRPPAPGLAARVYDAIGQQRFDAWVSRPVVVAMQRAGVEFADAILDDPNLVLAGDDLAKAAEAHRRRLRLIGWGSALVLGVLAFTIGRALFGWGAVLAWVLLVWGLRAGLRSRRHKLPPPVWRAWGNALREQTEGFRQFIATAEADRLDFEADADIFERYLPWAVLFGLTERWTRVCRDLAAAGRIPPVQTSLMGAQMDLDHLSRDFDRMERALADGLGSGGGSSSSTWGDSGSSSGSSDSASGGSGGGGTSADSW